MHFQQPHMLWGLLLLAIPLLIHLFQFHRTKTVYFPGVFRLSQRLQQARHQKRLQHWWVLLSRMLAITCLVLAFAMPSCSNIATAGKGYSHVVVLIDNGFSLSVETSDGVGLESVKSQARVILKDLPEEVQVKLISQTAKTESWLSPSQVISILDTLGVGPQKYVLSEWLDVIERAAQETSVNQLAAIVFSDAQQSFLKELPPSVKSTNVDWRFVQVPLNNDDVKGGNLSLDSAWYVSQFSAENTQDNLLLRARVSHRGGDLNEAQLQLVSNGKTIFAQTKNIQNGETVEFEGVVSANSLGNPLILKLGNDGYLFDNQLFLHPVKLWKTTVGVVGNHPSLDALFQSQPILVKKPVDVAFIARDPSWMASFDALIVVDALKLSGLWLNEYKSAVEDGLVVLHFTSNPRMSFWNAIDQKSIAGGWNRTSQRMAVAGLNHPVFKGAFSEELSDKLQLPTLGTAYKLENRDDFETVIQLEDGQPLFVTQKIENGSNWYWLSDLQEGSKQLLNSAWFLPLVTQVLASRSIQEKPMYGVLYSKQLMSLPASVKTDERAAQLQGMGKTSVVELQTNSEKHTAMYVGMEPSAPGFYTLFSPLEKSPTTVAFNWSRVESDLQSDAGWKDKLSTSNPNWQFSGVDERSSILKNEPLKALWRLFIWGAAFFFAVEVLLLYLQSRKKSQETP